MCYTSSWYVLVNTKITQIFYNKQLREYVRVWFKEPGLSSGARKCSWVQIPMFSIEKHLFFKHVVKTQR